MAVISELVRVIAEVEGLEENFVSVYARSAREAGLISHHGRGKNAAKMTTRDAANLLIAVNASTLAKNVPHTIAAYSELYRKYDEQNDLSRSDADHLAKKGVSFIDALIFLLDSDQSGRSNSERILEEARDPQFTRLEPHLQSVLRLEFDGPQPSARLKLTSIREMEAGKPPKFKTNADLRYFSDFKKSPIMSTGDRLVTTAIRSKTLIAVASILRT